MGHSFSDGGQLGEAYNLQRTRINLRGRNKYIMKSFASCVLIPRHFLKHCFGTTNTNKFLWETSLTIIYTQIPQ
jgi:hypothetical protein